MTKPTYDELVAVIEAQHGAIDWLAASLMMATRGEKADPFFLSKSPVWPTVEAGHKALQAARR